MGRGRQDWNDRSEAWLDQHWIALCAVGYPIVVGLGFLLGLVTGKSDPLSRALLYGAVPFVGIVLRGLIAGPPSTPSLWDRLPGPSKNPDDYR